MSPSTAKAKREDVAEDVLTVAGVVAKQVRELRKRRRLTQKELAGRVADGMKQQTLALLESGTRGISVTDLLEVAAALDVAPVELLAGTFDPTDVPVGKLRLSPSDGRQWICGLKPLPGGDERLYFQQTPAGGRAYKEGYPSLAMARHDMDGWEKAVMSGDIDQEESSIRLLLEHARRGLRDLQIQRGEEYFTPERNAQREQWREQFGWED